MSTWKAWKLVGQILLASFGIVHLDFSIATESVTYVYTDPQGTVLAEADEIGNLAAQFDYRPFGRLESGGSPNGPGYTGHVTDADTSLVYMQARYYDPEIGRFLSTDPESAISGMLSNFNRFAYANNNPIVNTDPDGRRCIGSLCDDYIRGGRICDLTCVSTDGSTGSSTIAQSNDHPTTLAAVTVVATTETASATTSVAVMSTIGLTVLGGGLFVMDGNGFHDIFYGKQGCYGAISCDGPTLQLNEGKKIPKPNVSGKDGAKDVPSWAKGERPNVGESGKDFADRLFGKKYGGPPSDRGPGSEWSKIRKWGDRSFSDP